MGRWAASLLDLDDHSTFQNHRSARAPVGLAAQGQSLRQTGAAGGSRARDLAALFTTRRHIGCLSQIPTPT
jgi:hypothetical protein